MAEEKVQKVEDVIRTVLDAFQKLGYTTYYEDSENIQITYTYYGLNIEMRARINTNNNYKLAIYSIDIWNKYWMESIRLESNWELSISLRHNKLQFITYDLLENVPEYISVETKTLEELKKAILEEFEPMNFLKTLGKIIRNELREREEYILQKLFI